MAKHTLLIASGTFKKCIPYWEIPGRWQTACMSLCVREQFGHVSVVNSVPRCQSDCHDPQKQQTQVRSTDEILQQGSLSRRLCRIIITLHPRVPGICAHALEADNIPVHVWAANQTHHPLGMFGMLWIYMYSSSCQYRASLHRQPSKSGPTSCRPYLMTHLALWRRYVTLHEEYMAVMISFTDSQQHKMHICRSVPWKCKDKYILKTVFIWILVSWL